MSGAGETPARSPAKLAERVVGGGGKSFKSTRRLNRTRAVAVASTTGARGCHSRVGLHGGGAGGHRSITAMWILKLRGGDAPCRGCTRSHSRAS